MSAGLLHDWANISVRAQSWTFQSLTWRFVLLSVIRPEYKNVYSILNTVYGTRFTLYCRLCTALVDKSLQKVQNYHHCVTHLERRYKDQGQELVRQLLGDDRLKGVIEMKERKLWLITRNCHTTVNPFGTHRTPDDWNPLTVILILQLTTSHVNTPSAHGMSGQGLTMCSTVSIQYLSSRIRAWAS